MARKAAAAAKAPAPVKPEKPLAAPVAETPAKGKPKLVRDSFTFPKSEYAVLSQLKSRTLSLGRPAKKSELIRAGIAALNAMSDKALLAALAAVPNLKTGRPRKEGAATAKRG